MLRTLVTTVFLTLCALSLTLNVLTLAGCFQQNLVREKDEIVARFSRRVEELEQANQRLAAAIITFERQREAYEAERGKREAAFQQILKRYAALKNEVRP